MVIFENTDIDIDIDNKCLRNINIDIDKKFLRNTDINIDKGTVQKKRKKN